jgi:DNA-binding transcriptional regulator GbsR (MarR family)
MAKLSEEDKFIEKTGIFFEKMGITQMSGRILGYLMVSDNPIQSLKEITERLGVAKSSVSTALKSLQAITMVIKRGRPSSREDYYELNPHLFQTAVAAKSDATLAFKNLIFEAYQLNKVENDRQKLLNEIVYFYDFFLEEYPKIFVKWEEKKLELITEGKI